MVDRQQAKAAVSILTLALALSYFDVFRGIASPSTHVSKQRLILCLCFFLVGAMTYFWNALRFIISPRVSQRITSERWIYKSPLSVLVVLGAYAVSFSFGAAALIPEYGILVGLFISVLCAVAINDVSNWIPF